MFGDNQYNWGRVVTVYAFAGWLARYVCCSKDSEIMFTQSTDESINLHNCAEQIAQLAGDFVAERLGSWIFKQGGWVSVKYCSLNTLSHTSILRSCYFLTYGQDALGLVDLLQDLSLPINCSYDYLILLT